MLWTLCSLHSKGFPPQKEKSFQFPFRKYKISFSSRFSIWINDLPPFRLPRHQCDGELGPPGHGELRPDPTLDPHDDTVHRLLCVPEDAAGRSTDQRVLRCGRGAPLGVRETLQVGDGALRTKPYKNKNPSVNGMVLFSELFIGEKKHPERNVDMMLQKPVGNLFSPPVLLKNGASGEKLKIGKTCLLSCGKPQQVTISCFLCRTVKPSLISQQLGSF